MSLLIVLVIVVVFFAALFVAAIRFARTLVGPAVTIAITTGKVTTMPTTVPVTEILPLSLAGLDANNNASLVGVTGIAWSIDNGAVASLVPAADGLTAEATALAIGTATVTVSATLADGTAHTATLEIDVPPGPAVSISIVAGTPVPAPAPVPAVEYFTFTGDPTTVDAALWPKADVVGANGEVLYTHSASDSNPITTEWVRYTGTTQPAPVA